MKTKTKSILVSPSDQLIPVLKGIGKEGVNIWGATPNFAQILQGIDLKAKPLGDLLTPEMRDQTFSYTADIIAAGRSVIGKNGINSSAYEFIKARSSAFIGPRVFDICALILALDVAKPDLIIVHNDVEPRTRAICLWAQARNVPSLHVPHAIYQDVRRDGPLTDVHDLITCSHLASAGKFQTEWYKKRGFPERNIRETGRPVYDKWANLTINQNIAKKQLGLEKNKPVIMYASTWGQSTNLQGVSLEWQEVYKNFLETAKTIEGLQVLVKCHPVGGPENWQWHAETAQKIGVECTITPEHTEICLSAADVVIAYGGSNLILDGSFVPHLRLMTTHGYEQEESVLPFPLEQKEMTEAIANALAQSPKDTTSLRYNFLGDTDGNATQRVIDFAMELLN